MADENQQEGERTLDASARKIEQARERGEVPVSREGSVAAIYIATLVAVLLTAGPIARHIGEILLPMLDQPEAFLDATPEGWSKAGQGVSIAIALAVVPFFALMVTASLLPYMLQNAVAISVERIMPKFSHLSPMRGIKKIFGLRSLFEFAKNLVKLIAVSIACFVMVMPLYRNAASLIATNVTSMLGVLQQSLLVVLLATTLVAAVIAGIDIPYQHWTWRRRMRMTVDEMRKEMRESEGDPHIRARRRKLRLSRARQRMMHDVPKATVVITNPTHYAVALRYLRGKDSAPVVVAKGADMVAGRIRQIAFENEVAIVENAPLARALHATVDIGEVIPHEHFEAVAKIIGVIWAQRSQPSGQQAA
jgi:flagellar biosynthetic protein FlhB